MTIYKLFRVKWEVTEYADRDSKEYLTVNTIYAKLLEEIKKIIK